MLTLQFVPYHEVESLNEDSKIKKLLDIVKEDKIVLMQGRLTPAEESMLIQKTMESVDRKFRGIELCTIYPEYKKKQKLQNGLKKMMAKLLLGNREGVTIIGPASIVKEIKRDPNKVELLTNYIPKKSRRK
ncbi:MAG: DUF2073 domain-containing protein [archaeon]